MTFGLMFFFMIMVFWRPQEWLVPWMFGWPILDAVVAVAVVTFYLELDQGRLRFPRGYPQFYLFVGLWLAAIFSHVPHTYFAGMMATIVPVFKVCFFGALLFCTLDRPSRLRWVSIAFVVMACVMAYHALLQEKTGYGFVGQRPLYYDEMRNYLGILPHTSAGWAYTRSLFFGIFHDPNDLAQMFAASVPFAFVVVRKRFWWFVFGCLISWFLILGIMSTHSRGGYIALGAALAVVILMALPKKLALVLAIVMAVGALFAALKGAAFMDESAQERVVYWGWANQAFKQNPIVGLGYGMFWQVVDRKTAHNAFVLCYTTIGFLGYWFWFGLIQSGIIGAWRARYALREPKTIDEQWLRRFAGVSIASMAGFAAAAYFLSRTFIYPLFFLFATLGAVPVVAEKFLPEGHPPLIRLRRDLFLWGTLGAAGSIIYIYVSILLMNKGYYG